MKPVSDLELAILREIWTRGRPTIREITDALYAEGTAPQYATVQKLLERLEAKRCVRRDRSSRAHRFVALVTREDFIGSQLQDLADKICEGSLTPLLTSLVQSQGISPQEIRELRRLIDDSAAASKPRAKRS